jgi:hypothetical protein
VLVMSAANLQQLRLTDALLAAAAARDTAAVSRALEAGAPVNGTSGEC